MITCRQTLSKVSRIVELSDEVPKNLKTHTRSPVKILFAFVASIAITEVLPDPDMPWRIHGLSDLTSRTVWRAANTSSRPLKDLKEKYNSEDINLQQISSL